MTSVILASASPRRADILRKYGIPFEQISSGAEEPGAFFAENAAMSNAKVKAEDLSQQFPDRIVIAADTVIEFEEEVIGKPSDVEDAVRILKRLSGKKHFVTTGVCILHACEKVNILFADVSEVKFKQADESVIREYISRVNVLDKAGAYALQEYPELIIESVKGDPENVIGLPVRAIETLKMLLSGQN
jgi:septum formation protein